MRLTINNSVVFCSPKECHGDILIKLRALQKKDRSTVGYSPVKSPQEKTIVSAVDSHLPTKSGIAVIMDSNRRHIDFRKLFPEDEVKTYACGTVRYALQKIPALETPKTIILHLGTNDIESDAPQEVCNNLLRLKTELERKYDCLVLISSILPRSDELSNTVPICNDILLSSCRNFIITHTNITMRHLHDKKHLSFRSSHGVLSGCQLLAQNLYLAVRGSIPQPLYLQNAVSGQTSQRNSPYSGRNQGQMTRPQSQASRTQYQPVNSQQQSSRRQSNFIRHPSNNSPRFPQSWVSHG